MNLTSAKVQARHSGPRLRNLLKFVVNNAGGAMNQQSTNFLSISYAVTFDSRTVVSSSGRVIRFAFFLNNGRVGLLYDHREPIHATASTIPATADSASSSQPPFISHQFILQAVVFAYIRSTFVRHSSQNLYFRCKIGNSIIQKRQVSP